MPNRILKCAENSPKCATVRVADVSRLVGDVFIEAFTNSFHSQ
jgi:hypothetical protein